MKKNEKEIPKQRHQQIRRMEEKEEEDVTAGPLSD